MIAKYNSKSFLYGVPGILLQIGGNIAAQFAADPTVSGIGTAASILGTILLLVGLAFYAKAKGRNPAWC